MARSRTVYGPPRSGAYVGMLGLAAFAMLVGIGALVLEAGEYEWDSQPKAGTVSLPKFEPPPRPGATPAGNAPAPSGGAQAEPVPAPTAPPPPAVATAPAQPAPAPEKPKDPAPAVAATPAPPVTVPADQNRGPRPGFNLTLPRFPAAQPSSTPTGKDEK